MTKAKIADIFYSIQGEGSYAGNPQLFLRFYGCNISCRFCDTRLTAYDKYTPLELYRRLQAFTQPYHSLCLTGGEPLLQKNFLKEFLKLIKYDGKKIYLETNGTLPEALAELIDDIDIIAMDLKLPSSSGLRPLWSANQRFLKLAKKKELFIKMVICASTEKKDLEHAVSLLKKLRAQKIPVVLQPNFFELDKELLGKIRLLQKYCSRHLGSVTVIPQLHRMIGVK